MGILSYELLPRFLDKSVGWFCKHWLQENFYKVGLRQIRLVRTNPGILNGCVIGTSERERGICFCFSCRGFGKAGTYEDLRSILIRRICMWLNESGEKKRLSYFEKEFFGKKNSGVRISEMSLKSLGWKKKQEINNILVWNSGCCWSYLNKFK